MGLGRPGSSHRRRPGVILIVVLSVALIGLVTGVVLGLAMAVATFVVRYSKVGVIDR